MKNQQKLPPTWVRLFSWCFAYLTIIPLLIAIQFIFRGGIYGLSAYGFKFEETSDATLFLVIISIILLLGGLTGIFILTRCVFAYDFGIVYCSCALLAICYGHSLRLASQKDGATETLLLICFLVHLIRHRKLWVRVQSNNTHSVGLVT